MLKILHLSDLHLGYSYSQKPSTVRIMNDELVRSFERAITYCIEEKMDILLLAGDIFHHSKPSYATERIFLQGLRKLDAARILSVYCGGNHDPKGSLVHSASYRGISGFVPFVNPTAEVVRREVRGVPVCFVGSGYEGKQGYAKITDYPYAADLRTSSALSAECLVIGISHLSVDSKEALLAGNVYNSTRLVDLESLGYDYFALGHIHIRQVLGEYKNVAYSGNLQGLHVNETGNRGGLRLDFELSEVGVWNKRITEVNFSGLRFEQYSFDVSDCVDLADLEYALEVRLYSESGSDAYRYVRVRLEGCCRFYDELLTGIADIEEYLMKGRLLGVEIHCDGVSSAAEVGEETLGGLLLDTILHLDEDDVAKLKREGILHRGDDLAGLVSYLKAQVSRKLR